MSKREAEILSVESWSKKIKTDLSIDEVKTEIVKTLAEKLIEYTENNSGKNREKNCTDRIVGSLKDIIDSELNDFVELTESDKDKKSFIKNLIKRFTLLLSTKCKSLQKIKKTIKLSTEKAINP